MDVGTNCFCNMVKKKKMWASTSAFLLIFLTCIQIEKYDFNALISCSLFLISSKILLYLNVPCFVSTPRLAVTVLMSQYVRSFYERENTNLKLYPAMFLVSFKKKLLFPSLCSIQNHPRKVSVLMRLPRKGCTVKQKYSCNSVLWKVKTTMF